MSETKHGTVTWTHLWKILSVDATVRPGYALQSPADGNAALCTKRDAQEKLSNDVRNEH